MKTKVNNLVLHHHTGLGDSFICNGIVHIYAENFCNTLHLPCEQRYYETINCLYQDFDNIIVHPFNENWAILEQEVKNFSQENKYPLIRIGFENLFHSNLHRVNCEKERFAINFDRQFYEQANVLYKDRYEKFILPKKIINEDKLYDELTEGEKDYILVHKSSSLNESYPIDIFSYNKYKDIKVIEILKSQTSNLLDYVKLIKNAKEIHCVPSSFHCLVDSISRRINAGLYYHNIRLNTLIQVNCCTTGKNRWNVIDYQQKI